MAPFKRFATDHVFAFSVLIALLVLVLYTVAGVFAGVTAPNDVSRNLLEALGRLAGAALFAAALWRLGWLDGAGVTRAGSATAWVVMLVFAAYECVAWQFPLFGNVSLEVSDPATSVAVGVNALATGPIEELPFRGIVLFAFFRLWGHTKAGIVRSVVCSAALFSLIHLIHLALGGEPAAVLLKLAVTFLSGIYFAALVLRWRTIWPVVVYHGVINAVMSVRAVEVSGFTETATALGTILPLQIPLVILGVYWIWKAPPLGAVAER
jgi:membrane protease YdiL (CAAX protease family)